MPTYTELMRGFEFGPWHVIPERGLLRDGDVEQHLEPLVMDVFVVLASHGGEVVTKDQLIAEVWDGRPQTDDVITRCISALRKGLGDDAKSPTFVETVQRRGYRVMQPVSQPDEQPVMPEAAPSSVKPDIWVIVVGFLAVAAIAWYALIRPDQRFVPEEGLMTIAVYPFDCLQATDESNDHLCFGFAEEAISSLKQVADTQIIRKRTSYDREIFASEDNIVTGSVQIIGGEVKISAQLEDADDSIVIWSDTFADDINGIFDLQRQVAAALRGALDENFTDASTDSSRPTSYAANEAYSLGRYLFEKRGHDSIVEAIESFERAIELDPGFGPAWLGLAYTYSIWPDYDPSVNRWETFDRALQTVEEGVQADPSIRDAARTVVGYIYHKQNRWADALANTTAAVNAMSPSADDYHWHSRVLASVGLLNDSLQYARLGAELDPEYPVLMSRLAISSFWVNDLENAGRYFRIADQMDLGASVHLLAYSFYLIRTGQFEEAKARAARAINALDPAADPSWVGPVFDGVADPSKRDEALAVVDQLQASNALPDNVLMTLSVLLGDVDRAMQVGLASEPRGAVFELELIYIDEFRDFRRHEQFAEFAQKVGLQDFWDQAGCTWIEDRVVCPEGTGSD